MTTHASTVSRAGGTFDLIREWLEPRPRQAVVAFVLYATITIGYFGLHVLPHFGSADVGLTTWSDPTIAMWSLAWWPHALLHGLNPFFTNALFVPDRFDLGGAATIPGAALVLAPVTLLFGSIASYNLVMLASPVLAAFFAFLLCRYITGNFAASLVGGYLFGFSNYMLAQMLGHPHLVLVFPIPAAVHLTLRLIDAHIAKRQFVALMALTLAALLSFSSEVALTFVLLGIVALAVAFVLAPDSRQRIISAVGPILAAGAAAALVTSPLLYYGLKGNRAFPAAIGNITGGDALGFFVPSPLIRLGRNYFAALWMATNTSGSAAEQSTYVGLPLALIVARYTLTRWRLTSTRILVVLLAIVVVLLLGSHLHIAGYQTIPLPWDVINYWLLRQVIPARLALYMFLIVAVIAARWLAAQPRSRRWGMAKWAVAAASIAFLVPNLGSIYWRGNEYNPTFFTTDEYRSVLTRDEIVLVLPFGQFGTSMLWQEETGWWFRMAGGFVSPGYPTDYAKDPLYPAFFGQVKPDPAQLRSFLVRRHVGAVIVDPTNPQNWPEALAALRLKPMPLGGIFFYRIDGTSRRAQ